MEENQKDAVNIGVTLSTQLIAASLTMIAVVGAFTTFIIDKRNVGTFYYIIVVGTFLSFISSIYLGGKGIDKARTNGFDGNWNLIDTKWQFNWQATMCLIGVLLFFVSIFMGKSKENDLDDKLLKQDIIELRYTDSLNRIQLQRLQLELNNTQIIKDTSKSATRVSNILKDKSKRTKN